MSYRRVREENIKPEYLRLKQAMIVFNMGPDKIEELARDRLCFSEQRGKSPEPSDRESGNQKNHGELQFARTAQSKEGKERAGAFTALLMSSFKTHFRDETV